MMDQLGLAQAFRAGDLTVTDYISQVETYFAVREPPVQAFLPEANRFERLCKEAEDLISQYPDPQDRPPLFGLLVSVKDIFHVDGFATRAGSQLPVEELQGAQAESVTILENAGALVLGKTVTTEFAYFTPGSTRNPHNLEHTPGGSSSGSAAAVGAGLCPFALGTQTIGSIIRPAAFCGVVGFKPTYERISREGIIPLSPSLDHVGFFTPGAATAKRVGSILIRDWKLEIEGRRPVLGIPTGPYFDCASDYARASFRVNCNLLLKAGYVLKRIRVMDEFPEIRARHDAILSAEAAQVHEQWFEKHEDLYSSKFADLVKRGQKISNLRSQLIARDTFRDQITQAMHENNIDLWICPSAAGPAPKGLESTGDPVMDLPWTQIGFPAISLPAGKSEEGLPMGLQVVGKWGMDEELLTWAGEIEKVVSQL